MAALTLEIANRPQEATGPVETLYFGGGSPSILTEKELAMLMDALHQNYDLTQLKEATIETNPDDHSPEKLKAWQNHGFNRLSIGIQSFIDRDLRLMNRAHNAMHASECVQLAREAGFNALTIDLIYGIPGQSMAEWQKNIDHALRLEPDHISAYCLTVENKTALEHHIKTGQVTEKEDEQIELEYLHLHQQLVANGFEHYEISNFAQQGKRALHNSNYWQGKDYLGFGPSAHSYSNHGIRRWNVSNNGAYMRAVQAGNMYWEIETITIVEKTNEAIMTGLRTAQGIKSESFSAAHWNKIMEQAKELKGNHQSAVKIYQDTIIIKPEQWLLADGIIRSLMID